MNILAVKGLTKSYGIGQGKVVALNHLTFDVQKGEFISIIGKSGCGKSTLLHLLAGLDIPDSGEVFLNGTNIFKLKKDRLAKFRRREIGVIYQFYNLVPVLTVEENIVLPVRLDKKAVDKRQLDKVLDLLGLTERRKHLPNQLSGGQQQRTAIGRALFFNPSIILADEPTGNLDKNSGEQIIKYFEILNKEFSHTIIVVTHDESIANRAARKITMSDGEIIEDNILI